MGRLHYVAAVSMKLDGHVAIAVWAFFSLISAALLWRGYAAYPVFFALQRAVKSPPVTT